MKKLIYAALLFVGVVILMAPPAMAQEEKPFTIHGEVRFRGEYQSNASDFNDDGNDAGDFWPFRIRIAAEGHFTKNVSAWIEFQDSGHAGAVNTPIKEGNRDVFDGDGVEMYQGNVTFNQLWSKNFSLRFGRQEIVAGNEMLLGDLDFYAGLSHDGITANWNLKKVNLMLWATRPNQSGFNSLDANFETPDNQGIGLMNGTQTFLGGYATWTFHKDQTFDVYLMDLSDKTNSDIMTVGARYAHDVAGKSGIFWDAEIAGQSGKFDFSPGNDVDASGKAIEGWFGYAWKSGKNTHRIYGRLENASGDDTSTADKNEGFQPMFGDYHNRLGHGDWFRLASDSTNLNGGPVTGTGIQALSVGYTGTFSDRHEFGAAYWTYSAAEDNGGDDSYGNAIDVWYGYNYSRNATFSVSLSQLSPDDGLTGGGNDDSVTRLYGQVRLRF